MRHLALAAALVVISAPAMGQSPAFDLQTSREHGIEAIPSPDVGLELELRAIDGGLQRALVITILDLDSASPTSIRHTLVSPGDVLYYRSPRSDQDELHVRVVVGPADGESILETTRVNRSRIVSTSRVRIGTKQEVVGTEPAA